MSTNDTNIFDTSFDTLYQRCRHACYATIRPDTKEDMEDAIQEAGLEIWRSMQENPDNTPSWFVNRGVFYARNYLRSKVYRHTNRQLQVEQTDEKYDVRATADQSLYRDIGDLFTMLSWPEGIPDETNKIITMIMDGYTKEQVGEMLGISRWTVTRRLEEVKGKFSEILHA